MTIFTIIILTLVIAAVSLSRAKWATLTSIISWLQLYRIPLPYSVLSWVQALSAPFTIRRETVRGTKSVGFGTLLPLALLSLIATILWSPDIQSGFSYTVSILTVLVTFWGFNNSFMKHGPKKTLLGFAGLAPILTLQSISTVVFLINPELEGEYLSSPLALELIGQSASEIVNGDVSNNVTDPLKAAGLFFVNGNRASMVMGVAGLIYLSFAVVIRSTNPHFSRLYTVTGFICLIGSFFTWSKTAWAILFFIPFAAVYFVFVLGSNNVFTKYFGSVVIISLQLILLLFAMTYGSDYFEKAEDTSTPRFMLWGAAVNFILESPITGIGFGGWAEEWPSSYQGTLLGQPDFPPHNFLLAIGLNTGLLGIVFTLSIMISIVRFFLKRLKRTTKTPSRAIITLGLLAWIWVFVHGMGDNTDFWGTVETIPLLTAISALVSTQCRIDPCVSRLGESNGS